MEIGPAVEGTVTDPYRAVDLDADSVMGEHYMNIRMAAYKMGQMPEPSQPTEEPAFSRLCFRILDLWDG